MIQELNDSIYNFDVQVYGNFQKYSDTISKARVRIFYKGVNRNNTYISEEFAQSLLQSLPCAPVKGIYRLEENEEDFSTHGKERNEGRAYGFVPPDNFNFAWEDHEDEDGVIRTYACVDVFLWTALYPEANEIVGKPQSMELYKQSVTGDWKLIEGRRTFEFKTGSFLGLQVLGKTVEPCFEGAEFYSLYTQFKEMVEEVQSILQFAKENNPTDKEGGSENMIPNFKLSDSEKHDVLFQKLNPNYNKEGDWEIQYYIQDVYDNYAFVHNSETKEHFRVYFQKNDESNDVVIDRMERRFVLDLSEEEMRILETIKGMNGGSFEKLSDEFVKMSEGTKDEAAEGTDVLIADNNQVLVSGLQYERDILSGEKIVLLEKVSELEKELETLIDYKKQIEKTEKESILTKYAALLEDIDLSDFEKKIDEFTPQSLAEKLSFLVVEKNQNLFTKSPEQGDSFYPAGFGSENLSGIKRILEQRRKKNGGEN